MQGNYNEFERISDVVLVLDNSNYGCLKMNVRLGHKNKNGYREPFATGFIVNGSGYRIGSNLISIKREFDYFLSFEVPGDNNFYVQVRAPHMLLVKTKFEDAFKAWFMNDSIWTLSKDGIPKVNISKVSPIEIRGLSPNNRTIRLDPIVINRFENYDKGLRITVSESTSYMDLDMDRLMGLIYTLNTFDLYQAAINQINSLTIYQHPKFVQELVQMAQPSEYNTDEVKEPEIKAKPRKPKSFFDKDDFSKLEE